MGDIANINVVGETYTILTARYKYIMIFSKRVDNTLLCSRAVRVKTTDSIYNFNMYWDMESYFLNIEEPIMVFLSKPEERAHLNLCILMGKYVDYDYDNI